LNAKRFQRNAIARNRMFHGAKRLEGWWFNAETFCCADNFQIRLLNRSSRRQSALTILAGIMSGLIPLCGTATLVWRDFNIWEFPQVCIHNAGGPLADEKFSAALDDKRNESPRGGRRAPAKVWQFSHAIFLESDAEFSHGTFRAFGLSGCANQRAKFHEGLVEVRAGGCFFVLVLRSRPRPRIIVRCLPRRSSRAKAGPVFSRSGPSREAGRNSKPFFATQRRKAT
jgi:hypothetical protein